VIPIIVVGLDQLRILQARKLAIVECEIASIDNLLPGRAIGVSDERAYPSWLKLSESEAERKDRVLAMDLLFRARVQAMNESASSTIANQQVAANGDQPYQTQGRNGDSVLPGSLRVTLRVQHIVHARKR
jgi:hypothetical protein